MPTLRLPLVGSIMNRSVVPTSIPTVDQTFINAYPEVTANPITNKPTVVLYKRPGHTKSAAFTGTSFGTFGMVMWTGHTDAIAPVVGALVNTGGTSTSVWDLFGATKLGSDIASTSDCTVLTETLVSGTANLVGNFIDSGNGAVERWIYPQGGAWAQVTTNFPTNLVGFPVHMDGFTFDMTQDGFIVHSDVNSVTAYSVINKIQSQAYPDKGVTVARLDNLLLAFGEGSLEFFENTGNPAGSVLSRAGSIRMGAVRRTATGSHTVLQAFGSVYWIGTSPDGAANGIYTFNGRAPKKISSPAIDKMVASGGITGFLGSMCSHGMRHLVLQTTNTQICYCIDTGFWWRFEVTGSVLTASVLAQQSASPPTAFTYLLNSAGRMLTMGTDIYLDASSTYTMTVRTQNLDFGTHRKKMWQGVSVIGDVQTSSSPVNVSYSDDDFANFSSARSIDMSTSANRLVRWGASRRRAWKFEHATNTPLRLEAVEFEYEVADT